MSFKEIVIVVKYMLCLADGHARHSVRQSIINEMQVHGGFSAVRAEQVVDELERYELKKMKKV
ncbi:hypothetical protein D7X96_15995 [Corallococcus interemptor]|uniref:Uncharacterized protein n=1 Tax=Corallococcus interemptor TaxID=2316720 RepID=A0A3A8QQ75_9BACT|nr:hypothetical protein [Corallococcus interemptor]RKH69080.1 hypothetical protein D7X96_15995 [Corallococcus interemptor]